MLSPFIPSSKTKRRVEPESITTINSGAVSFIYQNMTDWNQRDTCNEKHRDKSGYAASETRSNGPEEGVSQLPEYRGVTGLQNRT